MTFELIFNQLSGYKKSDTHAIFSSGVKRLKYLIQIAGLDTLTLVSDSNNKIASCLYSHNRHMSFPGVFACISVVAISLDAVSQHITNRLTKAYKVPEVFKGFTLLIGN